MRDMKNSLAAVQSIAPAATTSTEEGASADLQGFRSATVVIDAGAWTDGTHTFSVEESDNDTDFTTVAAADLLGTAPVIDGDDDDAAVHLIGYVGSSRYIRVVDTVTGSPATGLVCGATIIKGHPLEAPTS